MILIKIIVFFIALIIAIKLLSIVGWLLKVGILIVLIGSVIWLVQEFFSKKEPS